MKVSLKTCVPAVTAGLLTLSSCISDDPAKRVREYLADKPYAEYEAITNGQYDYYIQSKLDSMAYRDIFESTQAAKDSALVENFNKIAGRMRIPQPTVQSLDFSSNIRRNAIKNGITTEKIEQIEASYSSFDDLNRADTKTQHYVDDWAYRKFFSEAGIMNDSIAKKCDEVSEKVRP